MPQVSSLIVNMKTPTPRQISKNLYYISTSTKKIFLPTYSIYTPDEQEAKAFTPQFVSHMLCRLDTRIKNRRLNEELRARFYPRDDLYYFSNTFITWTQRKLLEMEKFMDALKSLTLSLYIYMYMRLKTMTVKWKNTMDKWQ